MTRGETKRAIRKKRVGNLANAGNENQRCLGETSVPHEFTEAGDRGRDGAGFSKGFGMGAQVDLM